jgi:hypothetical protein
MIDDWNEGISDWDAATEKLIVSIVSAMIDRAPILEIDRPFANLTIGDCLNLRIGGNIYKFSILEDNGDRLLIAYEGNIV